MHNKLRLKGQIFGRLWVIDEDHNRTKASKVKWVCLCTCGNTTSVVGSHLKNGCIRSCGCLKIETTIKMSTKHGLTGHPLYTVWLNMKQRCNNPKNKNYKNYGGRGITICDRWLNSFQDFYDDMINGYKVGLELDRIDNDKGYYKVNCRWATHSQNLMNKGADIGKSSKYKGVHWSKASHNWVARVMRGGKLHHLGYFTDEKEAALIYNKKAKELFGEYANLNKVEY